MDDKLCQRRERCAHRISWYVDQLRIRARWKFSIWMKAGTRGLKVYQVRAEPEGTLVKLTIIMCNIHWNIKEN